MILIIIISYCSLLINLNKRNECFCGNSFGKYGKTVERDCNKACVGNPLLTCGGLFRVTKFFLDFF